MRSHPALAVLVARPGSPAGFVLCFDVVYDGFELFVVCRPAVWPGGLGRRRPILWLVVWTLAWQALGDVLQFYRSTVGTR